MINENRLAIAVQPWAVFLPVLAIGLLTVGTNLVDRRRRASRDRPGPRRQVMSAAETARPASVDVDGLRIELTGTDIDVVDEIALEIYPGEVLGLVGESGSGKTTVGMALLGHVRRGGARRRRRDPRSTAATCRRSARAICAGCAAATVSYIPQDPRHVAEPGAAHRDAARRRSSRRTRPR